MPLKAVIFDMDGVILDSEPLYREIQDKVFVDLGFTVDDREYDSFIGLGVRKMWERLIASRKLTQPIQELIELNQKAIYQYFYMRNKLEPMPGFEQFIDSCLAANIKTAVASSTARQVIEIILSKLGVIQKFSLIVSGEEVKSGKPSPDIFIETARKLKLSPLTCLVIEDSENGVKAAKAAGMYCIGLQNPNSGNQDLSDADKIVDCFDQIKLTELL
jgi:HAD superfamily hydrolase (TIGR01509 family)